MSTVKSKRHSSAKGRLPSLFQRNPMLNRLFQHQTSYERRLEQRRLRFERYERRRSSKASTFDRYLARWFAFSQHLSRFWVTHVFLFLFMVVYTIVGAYIFVALEREAEDKFRKNVVDVRTDVLKQLWESCTEAETISKQKWITKLKTLMWGHRGTLCKADAWVEQYEGVPNMAHPWNLPNAMMFCCTIFTTIGYGFSTPRTLWGRLFTILYAFIGIPYCLVLLTDIGDVMRVALKRIYIILFKFYYLGKCYRWRIVAPYTRITRFIASTPFFVIDDTPYDMDTAPSSVTDLNGYSRHQWRDSLYEITGIHEYDFILPIWIGWVLLCLYLVAGALLFASFEQWDFTESLYFLFISLTTIGFGDLMPEKINFAYIFFYIIIGLALASFFFTLLLENSRRSMRKARHKVTKALATRISDVEGSSPNAGSPATEYGDILNVHVVGMSRTTVTGQGIVQLSPRHQSRLLGLPVTDDQRPVALIQFSDPRLLDFVEEDATRQLNENEELLLAAGKVIFTASQAHNLLLEASQTSTTNTSTSSSSSPGASRVLQITERHFLEYIQERLGFLRSARKTRQLRKGSKHSDKVGRDSYPEAVLNADGFPGQHFPPPETQRISPELQLHQREPQRPSPEHQRPLQKTPPKSEAQRPRQKTPPTSEAQRPLQKTPRTSEAQRPLQKTPPMSEAQRPLQKTPPKKTSEPQRPLQKTPPKMPETQRPLQKTPPKITEAQRPLQKTPPLLESRRPSQQGRRSEGRSPRSPVPRQQEVLEDSKSTNGVRPRQDVLAYSPLQRFRPEELPTPMTTPSKTRTSFAKDPEGESLSPRETVSSAVTISNLTLESSLSRTIIESPKTKPTKLYASTSSESVLGPRKPEELPVSSGFVTPVRLSPAPPLPSRESPTPPQPPPPSQPLQPYTRLLPFQRQPLSPTQEKRNQQ